MEAHSHGKQICTAYTYMNIAPCASKLVHIIHVCTCMYHVQQVTCAGRRPGQGGVHDESRTTTPQAPNDLQAYMIQCTGYVSANTKPHQLCWGDWECGYHTSCMCTTDGWP